jgi:hypothetical protein
MSAQSSLLLLPLIVYRRRSWQVALLLAGFIAAASPCHAEHAYRTTDDAIDIVLPQGWRVDDSGIRGTLAIFYPDKESYQTGAPVIKLISRRIFGWTVDSATLEQSMEEFRKRMRKEGSQVLEEKRRRVGGEAAYECKLTRSQIGEFKMVLITVFRTNEYAFVLTAYNQQELDAKRSAFDGILSRLRWHRPERVYSSDDDALTLDVPLQWTVSDNYHGNDRFLLFGPADHGIDNVVAVSRWGRNGRSLEEFVRQYLRDSKKETVTEIGELKNNGTRYLVFTKIGDPPVAQRRRRLHGHDGYVLEFRLNRFNITLTLGDTSLRSTFSPPEPDRRDIRVMQTFVSVGDYIYMFNFNSFKDSYQIYVPVVEDMPQSVRWR